MSIPGVPREQALQAKARLIKEELATEYTMSGEERFLGITVLRFER